MFSSPPCQDDALVLSGKKLILFTVPIVGLSFGFVLEPILITQECFSYSWAGFTQGKAFSAPQSTPPARRLRMHKELGGDTAKAGYHSWQKGYPRLFGITGRDKGSRSDGTCLSKSLLCLIGPCIPGHVWTPASPWEVVNQFLASLCLCAQFFLYLLNQPYLNSWVF